MSLACRYCGKQSSTRQLLTEHELIHEGRRIKCDHCDKDYSSRKGQQRHMRSSHDKKTDQSTNTLWSVCNEELHCVECNTFYSVKQVREYEAHIAKHRINVSKWIIPFIHPSHILLFFRFRMNQRQIDQLFIMYECRFCGRVFTTKNQKEEHERVHLRDRVSCDFCPKTYSNKANKSRHVSLHHYEQRQQQRNYRM